MHRRRWLALLPIVFCLSGCLWTEQAEHRSLLKRFHHSPISPDHALIEVALIERPLGDEQINEHIWKQTDELVVRDADRRHALDQNGLRIGQIVGTPPSEFQQLLLSKRYCSNPQALIFPAGKTTPILMSSAMPLPRASFDLVQGQARTEASFDQARYFLDVTARFTRDGHTTLTFTPRVENGEPILPFQAAPERSTWEFRIDKASQKYPELSWEATLGPNQYLIVGARLERERTLGQTAFTEFIGEDGVQRLLVIRNSRSVTSGEAHKHSVEELVRADRAQPLALQATMPSTRAKVH